MDVAGDCLQTMMVPCVEDTPPNATSIVVDIEITWNGEAWTEPESCLWSCDVGFGEHAGECLAARWVECVDEAPSNATPEIVEVEVIWIEDEGQWSDPEFCAWSCEPEFGFWEGECLTSVRVPCIDAPPENAVTVDSTELVEISYEPFVGWSIPDFCEWVCDEGFVAEGEGCRPE